MIHVTHTKSWEVRDIPMNEKLTKILKEVIDKITFTKAAEKDRIREIYISYVKVHG